jgi:hypothetical protein
LVHAKSLISEATSTWIDNPDKNRLLVQLLNREFHHFAVSKGMAYFHQNKKIYYSTDSESRTIGWRSRYGKSKRTVAAKMFAEQLDRYVYRHAAFFSNFIQLEKGEFFLKILPTFVITEDGFNVIKGQKEGTIITRLSYNKYNSDFLNTILFWIYQLRDAEKDIVINDYISISSEPLSFETNYGILFDIPSSEFKLDIEEEDSLDGCDNP